MKKIFFGFSVFLSALISAQNYPDYYPTNNNSNSNNNNGNYGDEEDSYYFPEDYYYEYPSDYYISDFYQSSYNDYRNSINEVNWNRFFSKYRLSPYQIQQIMMLNDRYSSYNAWNSSYRYNPDRWYYDRFYALENILGPRIFVVFQNNYYNGYNPVVYYQNYRRQHYVNNVYVVKRYRNINVNRYRVDKNQFHQTNPRTQIGFNNSQRNENGSWQNSASSNGFRNDNSPSNNPRNNGFRNNTNSSSESITPTENGGFRNNSNSVIRNKVPTESGNFRNRTESKAQPATPRSNGGFRNNDSGLRNSTPEGKIESNSRQQNSQSPRTSNTSRQRFTAQ